MWNKETLWWNHIVRYTDLSVNVSFALILQEKFSQYAGQVGTPEPNEGDRIKRQLHHPQHPCSSGEQGLQICLSGHSFSSVKEKHYLQKGKNLVAILIPRSHICHPKLVTHRLPLVFSSDRAHKPNSAITYTRYDNGT